MGNIFNPDFQEFLLALNKNEVKYVLVGGYLLSIMDSLEQQEIWIYS
jgi:hypothetical protein